MKGYKQIFNPLSGNFDITNDTRIQYYDATIGSGGDYPTLGDLNIAIQQGKEKFKAIGNILSTNGTDINIPNNKNIFINLQDYELDMGSYNFTNYSINNSIEITGNYKKEESNTNKAKIKFNYNTNKSLFNLINIKITNICIENNSSNEALISTKGYFDNVYLKIPNYIYAGLGSMVSRFDGVFQNSIIEGINTDINVTPLCCNSNSFINNIILKGNSYSLDIPKASYIYVNVSGTIQITSVYLSNVQKISGNITYLSVINLTNAIVSSGINIRTIAKSLYYNVEFQSNTIIEGTTNYIYFKDCIFSNNVTVNLEQYSSNRIVFDNCIFNSNLYINRNKCLIINSKIYSINITTNYTTLNNNEIGILTLENNSKYTIITNNKIGMFNNNSNNQLNEIFNNF